jgi:outer membrane lipoprotein carrier protein
MRTMAVSLALAGLAVAAPAGQAMPSPDDLARRVQAHYDSVKDFQSDFTQVYRGAFTKAMPAQHGQVRIKKPGRMRWIYAPPQSTVWWADGVRIFDYDPKGRSGHQAPMPRDDEASPAYLFLIDRGNLVRDFTPSLAPDQPPGAWRLTLTPKRPDPDVKTLVLVVDRATLVLRGMERVDAQGGTDTFTFPNLKENVGLSDKDLAYEFPKGTAISR